MEGRGAPRNAPAHGGRAGRFRDRRLRGDRLAPRLAPPPEPHPVRRLPGAPRARHPGRPLLAGFLACDGSSEGYR